MKRRIILTIVFSIIFAIGLTMMIVGSLTSAPGNMSIVEIIGLILLLGSGVGLMIEGNLWLDYLSYRFGFIYWPILLLIAVTALVLGFFFVPIPANEELGTQLNTNNVGIVVALHALIVYLGIPMLEGHTSHYMIVENNYIEDYHIDTNEYYSEFYVPGWWKKLIAVGLIAGGYYGLSLIPVVHPWLTIAYGVIEIGFFLYLTVIAIIRRIKAR